MAIRFPSLALQHINHCSHSMGHGASMFKVTRAAEGTSTAQISTCSNRLLGATTSSSLPLHLVGAFPTLMHTQRVCRRYGGVNRSSSTPGSTAIVYIVVVTLHCRREVTALESLRAVAACTVGLSGNVATVMFPSCHVSHHLTHYVFLYCKMHNFICPYIKKLCPFEGRDSFVQSYLIIF